MADDEPTLTGKIKDKLIRTKEQWAKDGRALTGQTTRSGEVLVVRHAGDRLEVLGSIRIDP